MKLATEKYTKRLMRRSYYKMLPLLLLFCLTWSTAQAQEPRSKEERIKAIKIAFITEELELTTKQSEGFWPLYNELQEELKALRRNGKKKPDIDNMSDADLEKWLENHFIREEQKIAIQKNYIQKFKKVISIRQIAKLTRAEAKFKRELLKRAKERREGRGGKEAAKQNR